MTISSVRMHPALARGMNMFDWFMGPNIYSTGHQYNYITDDGLKELVLAGFTHIRLPVYARFIAQTEYTEAPFISARITELDSAIYRALSVGLSVVLAIFPEDEMSLLATFSGTRTAYGNLWTQLSNRYKKYLPTEIYFELVNEPHFQAFTDDATARTTWAGLHTSLTAAIRAETANHWILTTSYDWASVQNAIDYNPTISDTKTIYTAHYYEFILFTHQGQPDFGDPLVVAAHNMPYPVRQPECQNALDALDPEIAAQLAWYCSTGFGPSAVDSIMSSFASWADTNNVPVYLGEFGAGREYSISGDAVAWMNDVRSSAEKYGIPWANWALEGGFYYRDEDGNPVQAVKDVLIKLGGRKY